jgi:hypothetical protein
MTTAAPAPHIIANIWTEMRRLGVPMDSWCVEPDPAEGGPAYWVRVHPDALTDWDADWMTFDWDAVNGWTMDAHCAPGPVGSPVVMEVADPFDVPAVAAYFKAVIDGEITEFRPVPTTRT